MHSSIGATIAIGTVTALLAGFTALGELRAPSNEAAGRLAGDSAVQQDTAGTTVRPRWINDANILSLLGAMSARQTSAADVELENWHIDSVRALAASVARTGAELQHSADSVAAIIKLAPVPSALTQRVSAELQAQFDSIVGRRSTTLDRAFVRQQIASESLVSDYLDQLAAVAEHPELQSMLASASAQMGAQLSQTTALQSALARADSVAAADSAAARAARAAKRHHP